MYQANSFQESLTDDGQPATGKPPTPPSTAPLNSDAANDKTDPTTTTNSSPSMEKAAPTFGNKMESCADGMEARLGKLSVIFHR